jgi:hypothetical protein
METFRKLKLTDDALSRELRQCTETRCQPVDQDCGHHFPYLSPWDLHKFESFETERWKFLVPKFQKNDKFNFEFDEKWILPFAVDKID